MTVSVEQFPYVLRDPTLGVASLAPMLPLTLHGKTGFACTGLIDSGAAINVLPYSHGLQLGFDWELQKQMIQLSGNLAAVEAHVVVATAKIGQLPEVRLAFGWAKTDAVPLILGQVNFFLEYDVCFFRTRSLFEVRPRQA